MTSFVKSVSICAMCAFALAACDTVKERAELTPIELQTLQTRSFEAPKDIAFASTVSVLQDLGYTIINAELETGLISAEGMAEEREDSFASLYLGVKITDQMKVTAFVEEIGTRAQVRLNFVSKSQSSSAYGQNRRSDKHIIDANVYENAFNRIDQAIFVRTNAS